MNDKVVEKPAAEADHKKALDARFKTVGQVRVSEARMRCTDVNVFDGDSHAIKGVDLDIAANEVLAMIGPSGCGKSTLLRLSAGLEDVTDGVIAIDGQDATMLPPARRRLAMVFQSYALYPHMTVAQEHGICAAVEESSARGS